MSHDHINLRTKLSVKVDFGACSLKQALFKFVRKENKILLHKLCKNYILVLKTWHLLIISHISKTLLIIRKNICLAPFFWALPIFRIFETNISEWR